MFVFCMLLVDVIEEEEEEDTRGRELEKEKQMIMKSSTKWARVSMCARAYGVRTEPVRCYAAMYVRVRRSYLGTGLLLLLSNCASGSSNATRGASLSYVMQDECCE